MKDIQNLQLSDYLEILRRRILLIIIPGLLVGTATYFYVKRLPDWYYSETVILVEPQKIPADYVRPAIIGTIESRVSTITQQILSRTRLEKIIVENNLYPELRSKLTMEEVVRDMRNSVGINVFRADSFKLSYIAQDPQVAQLVTREIASLYIAENLKVREDQIVGVNEFLETQLAETERKLREQETRLSDFRMRNVGALPEQQDAILATLSRLQQQLQANIEAVNKLEEQRTYHQRLSTEFTALGNVRTTDNLPGLPLARESAESPDGEVSQLQTKKLARQALAARYTPDHPDVRKLDTEIAALEKNIARSKPKEASLPAPSAEALPPAQRTLPESNPLESDSILLKAEMQSQTEILDRQIRQGLQEQQSIRREMALYQARIDAIPRMQQMLTDIGRDYEITKGHYQALLAKRNDAGVAVNLERRQKGEQFRILDPASLPGSPYEPDRLKLTLGGLLAGLALGFGISVLLELKDESVRSENVLARLTNLPVLVSVPLLPSKELGLFGDQGGWLKKTARKLRLIR